MLIVNHTKTAQPLQGGGILARGEARDVADDIAADAIERGVAIEREAEKKPSKGAAE